jgi:hypothetical protein
MLEVQLKVLHLRYNAPKQNPAMTVGQLLEKYKKITSDPTLPRHPIQRKLCPHGKGLLTLEDLQQSGFKTKDNNDIWTDSQKDEVEKALKDYANDDIDIHTADPYYYISHHILQDQKNVAAVKKIIRSKYNI